VREKRGKKKEKENLPSPIGGKKRSPYAIASYLFQSPVFLAAQRMGEGGKKKKSSTKRK